MKVRFYYCLMMAMAAVMVAGCDDDTSSGGGGTGLTCGEGTIEQDGACVASVVQQNTKPLVEGVAVTAFTVLSDGPLQVGRTRSRPAPHSAWMERRLRGM